MSEDYECGIGCTGRPSCGAHKCGNVDKMCYCLCAGALSSCHTSELDFKWNDGI